MAQLLQLYQMALLHGTKGRGLRCQLIVKLQEAIGDASRLRTVTAQTNR